MLSDEEKKAINELKEEINKPVEVQGNKFNTFILYNIESAKTILNLIEKQSKEIEELKEKNEYLPNWVSKKYVSKDKIKAKIEEIENTGIDVAWEQVNYTIREQDRAKIEVLQSLLEKE